MTRTLHHSQHTPEETVLVVSHFKEWPGVFFPSQFQLPVFLFLGSLPVGHPEATDVSPCLSVYGCSRLLALVHSRNSSRFYTLCTRPPPSGLRLVSDLKQILIRYRPFELTHRLRRLIVAEPHSCLRLLFLAVLFSTNECFVLLFFSVNIFAISWGGVTGALGLATGFFFVQFL